MALVLKGMNSFGEICPIGHISPILIDKKQAQRRPYCIAGPWQHLVPCAAVG